MALPVTRKDISFLFVAHEGGYRSESEQVMLYDLLSAAKSGGSIEELALKYDEHKEDLLGVGEKISAGVVVRYLVDGLIWIAELNLVPTGSVFAVQIGIKLPPVP